MRGIRSVLTACVVLVAVFALVASSENKAKKVDEGSGSTTDTAPGTGDDTSQPEVFAVGDLVELGDWQVKVHGVTDPYTSTEEFSQPAAGSRWVAVDTEVFNNSDEPQAVSSILCFELLDDKNQGYSMTIAGFGPLPPDGEVGVGASRRGTLVYEVPGDAGDLRLQFKCDLLSTGSAVIDLT